MYFKKIITISLFWSCLIVFSQGKSESLLTCPSVANVQELINVWPHGSWLPLYESNQELASEKDSQHFSQSVVQFVGAEWNPDYPEAGHCFYQGSDTVILANSMLKPDLKQHPNWHSTTDSPSVYCSSTNENDCLFGGVG